MQTKINQITVAMKNLVLVVALLGLLVSVGAGCKNTAQGVGKDMEDAGEKIQEKTR